MTEFGPANRQPTATSALASDALASDALASDALASDAQAKSASAAVARASRTRLAARTGALGALVALVLTGCQGWPPQPRPLSDGHLDNQLPTISATRDDTIPAPVSATAFVPPPEPEAPTETYTVVVNNVPVNELLFALARDASLNVDVHPEVQGNITLNAIDQTLTQILDRVARQLPVRYEERNSTLSVLPDAPFRRTYQLDYVNLTRESSSAVETSANVGSLGGDAVDGGGGGGGGGGGNNRSDQSISGTSNNRLWETVRENIAAIVGGTADEAGGGTSVVLSREVGLISVNGTARQHEQVESYLTRVRRNAMRQVLIEATIVEVNLSDRFQAGIDWSFLSRTARNTFQLGTSLTGGFAAAEGGAVQGLLLSGTRIRGDSTSNFAARLLSEFGDVSVLSSPKVIALNNQPAVLKVVDNEVYFNISVETEEGEDGDEDEVTIDTEIRTVPIGIVMTVTPQIDRNGMVTMNVRPTITRVREFVPNPGIALLAGTRDIQSLVPVVQVRETETVLRVGSQQTAVIGGLMQDRTETDDEAIPGLVDLPTVGDLFNNRDRQQTKTELVVFLRPTVIENPDVEGDFAAFRQYLPDQLSRARRIPTPLELDPDVAGSGGSKRQ